MNVALTTQERLMNLRVERGLTLEQLEQQTGISKSALGSYENADMNGIIRDIREAHKKDRTSAPDTTAVDEIKNSLEEAVRFYGSEEEKRMVVFCRQLGIDYPKLTPEEFRVMIKVLGKSKFLKIPRKRYRRKRK